MIKKKCYTSNSLICEKECPTRWCCSTKCFSSPPPICTHELAPIIKAGYSDFYQKDALGISLKVKENGYCIFFDEKKECKIYPVRPFDCRIFPIDFIPGKTEGVWVLYDCPYSRAMDRTEIENLLQYFEKNYVREILETWSYDDEIIHRKGLRILRKMAIKPPQPPKFR